MKNLNIYINEGLADWGDNNTLNKKISKQTTKAAIKQEIIDWITNNTTTGVVKSRFTFDFDTMPIIVDYGAKIKFNENTDSLTNGIFQWGKVSDGFNCSGTNITTLEGAPKEIGKSFYCANCPNLTSLKGAPKEIGKSFDCSCCNSITSLEGAPQKVVWSFDCHNCFSLESLEGAPNKVGGYFDCSHCTALKSLDGVPKEVEGYFYCNHCTSLKSLEGAPKNVGGCFYCGKCGTQFTEKDVKRVCKVKGKIYC